MAFSDASNGIRTSNTYKPRAWRLLNAKEASNKSLSEVNNKENAFSVPSRIPTLLGNNEASII